MKNFACISNIIAKSDDPLGTILDLRGAGYVIVFDPNNSYIECNSPESAKLVECLNSTI